MQVQIRFLTKITTVCFKVDDILTFYRDPIQCDEQFPSNI